MARASRYEYETSPKKLEPYYAPKKKNQTIKKVQNKPNRNKQIQEKKMQRKIIKAFIVVISVLFAITYRNAQIDESFGEVKSLKSELADIEKQNTQLEVAIESSLNLNNLEEQARNLLGMQKLTNKQTEYVTLERTDYIETSAEQVVIEENEGFLTKIGNLLTQLFK